MSTSIGPLECTAYPSKIRLAPFWRGATSSGEMVEPLVYRKELLRCEEDVVLVVVVVLVDDIMVDDVTTEASFCRVKFKSRHP